MPTTQRTSPDRTTSASKSKISDSPKLLTNLPIVKLKAARSSTISAPSEMSYLDIASEVRNWH